MEGYYKTGKVNTSWWMTQITRGEEDRDRKIKESEFSKYEQLFVDYYLPHTCEELTCGCLVDSHSVLDLAYKLDCKYHSDTAGYQMG